MGNKIHLAFWRGDLEFLQYHTDTHIELCIHQYRRPDIFGVHPLHILAFRKHCAELQLLLYSNLGLHMTGLEDLFVSFGGGITAMDLALNDIDNNTMVMVYSIQQMLKARHFYRLGNPLCIATLDANYKSLCQQGLSNALLPKLGPKNIHATLFEGAPDFFTPLFVAVLANDLVFLKMLIFNGARPNLQRPTSEGNYDLLHLAARLDHHRLIPTLIEAGCPIDTDATHIHGRLRTPLVIAAHYGNLRSIRALVTSPGFDLQSSEGANALFAASQEGQFHVIPTLIKLGCKVDSSLDSRLVTPLHAAVMGNHVTTLETLLKLGANPLSVSSRGLTALHFAAMFGSPDVVPTLIQAGLSPYEPKECDKENSLLNPFLTAVCQGELGVLKAFVNSKCTVPENSLGFALLYALNVRYNYRSTQYLPSQMSKGLSVRFLAELVKLGCSITSVSNNSGFLPIHVAASFNDLEAIQLLINLGCSKNAFTRSSIGRRGTPMHIAAQSNSVESIQLLVANGCDPDFHHPLEDPPLHVAICSGSLEAVSALLKLGASTTLRSQVGLPPLFTAIRCDQAEAIEILHHHGVDLSHPEIGFNTLVNVASGCLQFEKDPERAAVSMLACNRQLSQYIQFGDFSPTNEKAIRMFLRQFEGESPGDCLPPPLHMAVRGSKRAAIKKLVQLGADINAWFADENPLFIACKFGLSQIVVDLIELGANMEAVNQSGLSAIHIATVYNHPNVVQTLIDKGCSVTSSITRHGRPDFTPFQLASVMCCPDILQILQHLVSDINQISCDHLSPLHLAILVPGIQIMALPNDIDCACTVPLRIDAARQEKTVKLLLEYGCHVNATDEEGLTPLDLAIYYKSVRLVYLLKRADGEKGKQIKDEEEMRKRIKYLENLVGSVIMDNKGLRHRVLALEGHLENLEHQTANMDVRLDNLEAHQQKQQSAMITVHSGKCTVYVVST